MTAAPPGSARPTYTFGALLGAGTFGEVYLARLRTPAGIEQDVAVKLLNPGLHPRSQPVSRMRDEGHMLASLNHPAILAVKDLCNLDGRIGLVTEYLPGADLHDAIFDPHDPIPPRALVAVIGALADALHVAWETPTPSGHPMGLVHRDVKPANVRLTPHGAVKLLDFGIAKSEDERRETATTERTAIGTPAYMAPEVQTYEVLDALPSRDVFALGCTLFEGLAHELFFEGMDGKEIVRLCNQRARFDAHLLARLPRIASQDKRLVGLTTRMLRYDHTQRPTAREVADTCAELAESLAGPTLRAWCRDHRWPEPGGRAGSWSGRALADQGALVSGVHPAAAATMAPFDDAAPAAGPTIVAPANATIVPAGATIVHLPPGAQGAQVQVGSTQVVVLPSGGDPPKRAARWNIEGAVTLTIGVGVLAAGFLLFTDPDTFAALMNGEVAVAWERVTGSGGVSDWDGPSEGGGAEALAPLLAEGRQWGARPDAEEATLVELALDGDADVIVTRAGQPTLALPADGSVLVPPGPVEVLARFATLGAHAPQLSLDPGPGEQVRIVCDARADSCVRR